MPPKKRRPGPKSKTQGVGTDRDPPPESPQPGPSRRPGPKSKTQPQASAAASSGPARRPGPRSRTVPARPPSVASTVSRKVFQCKLCQRLFLEREQMSLHKQQDHPEYVESLRNAAHSAAAESDDSRQERLPPRKSPPKKTRPSASTAHKTSKADKNKAPKHKTRNHLPLAINNREVAPDGDVPSNPTTTSG